MMVGSNNIDIISEEFANIRSWATLNNLKIHPNKTKEMIIYRRRNKRALPPTTPTIAGAERVYSMRVLGVTINQHLTMSDHVDNLIASGASSIYALRMLRSHGLQPKQLQLVARMTTIASLLYASPAW